MMTLMNPGTCKDIKEVRRAIDAYETMVREHQAKFGAVDESMRIAALLSIIPEPLFVSRFKGHTHTSYTELKKSIESFLADRRPGATGGHDPMDIGNIDVPKGTDDSGESEMSVMTKTLNQMQEQLNAFGSGGKGDTLGSRQGMGRANGPNQGRGKTAERATAKQEASPVEHQAQEKEANRAGNAV